MSIPSIHEKPPPPSWLIRHAVAVAEEKEGEGPETLLGSIRHFLERPAFCSKMRISEVFLVVLSAAAVFATTLGVIDQRNFLNNSSSELPSPTSTHGPDFTPTGVDAPQLTLPWAAPPGYTAGMNLGGDAATTTTTVNCSSTTPTPTATTECIVIPLGFDQDDTPQIHSAIESCGTDGTVTLPAPYVYTIQSRLLTHLVRSRLNIFGTLSFSPNLGYWISNSHRIEFQNQSTAWVITGQDYIIDGGGWQRGGIEGNGQAWYSWAAGYSNRFGRPVSLSIYNSSNATVRDFAIRQPQFWAVWVQDSHDVSLTGIYVNGTNTDSTAGDLGRNYETNLDGLDTMRVNNLEASSWLFHGGDDCVAPKSNSTNLVFRNLTCIGGPITFGSIGQYPGSPDYILNVTASDISVSRDLDPSRTAFGGSPVVSGGAYFKAWTGVLVGDPAHNGGGGGTGRIANVSFTNLQVADVGNAVLLNKCYNEDQPNCDTSTVVFADMRYTNVTGSVDPAGNGYGGEGVGIDLNCSSAAPCYDLSFAGIDLTVYGTGERATTACLNAVNVTGVECDY